MKLARIFVAAALLTAVPTAAQMPDEAAMIAEQQEAMAALSWMDGTWEGTVTTQTPGGEITLTQTERIETMANGTVRLIEGRGFNAEGELEFNAIGLIVYDPETDQYAMTASARGRATQAWLRPTESGFEWGFENGPAKISYSATYEDGVWSEEGFFEFGDMPKTKFLEMRLERTGDVE